MSGNQILGSFFANEKSLAEQQLVLVQTEIEAASTEEEKKDAEFNLSRDQAFLDVTTQI